MSNRIVHFEIHADNVQRAMDFYKKVFGWNFQKWDGPFDYWMVMTGDQKKPGIDGGMMKRERPLSNPGTEEIISFSCTVDVESIDDALTKIKDSGGKVTQNKMVVPGVGWMATCKDTEGNLFGIMQMDKKAE